MDVVVSRIKEQLEITNTTTIIYCIILKRNEIPTPKNPMKTRLKTSY